MKHCGLIFCFCFIFIHVIFLASSAAVEKTIVVDKSGAGGSFTTIQSAFDSLPSNNQRWIRVLVVPGVYREQVRLTKQFVLLEGDTKHPPTISWHNSTSLGASPTFHAATDNFVAKWINFENAYNYQNKTNARKPAVALKVSGDNSSFHECGFHSVQDTLWDDTGRHYFNNCHIEGLVDFIFGKGQSIYEACNITVLPGASYGYITAQGREKSSETNGFVMKSCAVDGKSMVYLGRPWRPYARVIFFQSNLSSIVLSEGWQKWDNTTNTELITFAENSCYGQGANTTNRVKWEKKLSEEQLRQFTSLSYISNDGWLQQQP